MAHLHLVSVLICQLIFFGKYGMCQSVPSFGFTTADQTDNDGHDVNVTLTLFWNLTIFECTIPKDPNGQQEAEEEDFFCNNAIQIATNDKQEYKIKVFYTGDTIFRPSEFHVYDTDNQILYTIDTFCGPIQYYYFHVGGPYPDFDPEIPCSSDYFVNMNLYEFEYLEFDINKPTYLTTLYVSFIDDIISNPNNTYGTVSPAKVTSFSITTASESSDWSNHSVNTKIRIRLHWDMDLYICTIHPWSPATTYTCNVANTSQVQSNCTDPNFASKSSDLFTMFVEVPEEGTALLINSISITDESGEIYEIGSFCQDISPDLVGTIGYSIESLLSSCNEFPIDDEWGIDESARIGNDVNGLSYEKICIDSADDLGLDCMNGVNIIGIEFSQKLFNKNNNGGKEAYVYPVQSLNRLVCDGGTLSPTTEPSFAPSQDPTSDPTIDPTGSPTIDPTNDPTSQPSYIPSAAPSLTPTYSPSNTPSITIDATSKFREKPTQQGDSQGLIIIVLAVSLGVVICGIVMYFVYRRGVKRGIRKATANSVDNIDGHLNVIDKLKQGETSNMDIFLGEHEEAPPAAYAAASVASSDDVVQVIELPIAQQLSRGKTETDPGRGEGNETVFDNINPNENEDSKQNGDGSVSKDTDNMVIDEKDQDLGNDQDGNEAKKNERGDDSDTMEMYENNDAAAIAMPDNGDIAEILEIPGSNPLPSALPKDEENDKLKIKNVDSLDDLYEPEDNETPGDRQEYQD